MVTAQRQSENLQRTAVPVDAVSQASLLANQVTTPSGLGRLVPGLTVAPAGGGGVFYFLRGIGKFTTDPFADPAIAFNIDDVYVGRTIASTEPFYDLERVEVVKGPQGTLYGRNATGGAINVVPVKPELGRFSGYLSAEYGNYNTYDVQGAINVPLGGKAALRISGDVVGHDGYLSDGEDDQKTRSVRVQVAAEPAPGLEVRISADYAHVGGTGQGASYTDRFTFNPATNSYVITPSGLSPRTGLFDPASQAFLQQSFVPQVGRNLGPISYQPYADNDIFGVNGQINYDTGAGKLTVISAYRPTDVNFVQALSGSLAGTREHDRQFSTEVRFAGKHIGIFDYTLGGLYYHEHQRGTFAADLQIYGGYTNYDTTTTPMLDSDG